MPCFTRVSQLCYDRLLTEQIHKASMGQEMLRDWKEGDKATVITAFEAPDLYPGETFEPGEIGKVEHVARDNNGAAVEVWIRMRRPHEGLLWTGNRIWLNEWTADWSACLIRNADYRWRIKALARALCLSGASLGLSAGFAVAEVLEATWTQDTIAGLAWRRIAAYLWW